MKCPHCQANNSLEVQVEAYTIYKFRRFKNGYPADRTWEHPAIRTDETDSARVVCNECGEEITESDLYNPTLDPTLTADDADLTIKFSSDSTRLMQHVALALYYVKVMLAYHDDNEADDRKWPEQAILMRASDDGVYVCRYNEMEQAMPSTEVHIGYEQIKSMTIMGL